jgi:amino acid transporter
MGLDIDRLRRPQWLIGGGAVALGIAVFLFKWFGVTVSARVPTQVAFSFTVGKDGWHSLTDTRWLLLLTIVVALLAVVAVADGREVAQLSATNALVAGLGVISALALLYRIVEHPHGGFSDGVASYSYGAKFGLYLAFATCLVVAYGGYRALRDSP